MMISHCCGAAMKAEYSSDEPYTYDDQYDLQILVFRCTKCGRVIAFNSFDITMDTLQDRER